jgi:glycosyltransferase involved in cell wall biosynthesis
VDPSSPPSYFIVVPVLDEAEALPGLLADLRRHGLLARTLFVDNGSRDGGPGLIRAAGGTVLHEPRRGYAYPCFAGAREAAARGAVAAVFMEGDGTDDPAQVRHIVGPVLADVADLVVGSRHLAVRDADDGRMPWHQRVGNEYLALALRLLFGLELSDDGPFRAVRLSLLEEMRLEERPWAFTTEMVVKARLMGVRIAVRNTRYRPRAGRSKIAGTLGGTVGATRDIIWSLLRLRLFGLRQRA